MSDLLASGAKNLTKNGNFINNSTNGYGGTPDDWTNSSANPVQGGIPTLTKQQLIDLLGVADGDIEGLWPLNEASGNASDLSSSNYTLTDNNTVDSSLDGLMGRARDFELANSEYLTNATVPNLRITGSQTFFAFIKPETITAVQRLMGRSTAAPANIVNIGIGVGAGTNGKVDFQLQNLTTNTFVSSDVTIEAGKWYFICGVYDSANSLLKVWVNGIKKQVTASGSSTAGGTETFSIGRAGAYAADYYDGLIQNACVLSVALSDDQVKRLFAATLYKGIKIRRATSNASMTQALPQDLVERLRGKAVAITAKVWQDIASTAQVSINDGSETASATTATTGSWVNIGVTDTISSTATSITLAIKHSTSDGNSWFKEVMFYEGGSLIYTWYPSYDDVARFPRLLRMDIPAVPNAYSFEEDRWFSYTSTGTVANCTGTGSFKIRGKECNGWMNLALTGAPGFSATVMPVLPITPASGMPVSDASLVGHGGYEDNGSANKPGSIIASHSGANNLAYLWVINSTLLSNTNPITWANGDKIIVNFKHEID